MTGRTLQFNDKGGRVYFPPQNFSNSTPHMYLFQTLLWCCKLYVSHSLELFSRSQTPRGGILRLQESSALLADGSKSCSISPPFFYFSRKICFMKKLFSNTMCTYLNLYACVLSSFVKGAVVSFSASFRFTFRLWTGIHNYHCDVNLRESWELSPRNPGFELFLSDPFPILICTFFRGCRGWW